uniref:G protein-coupled receptor kinase n=1 Tax=Knipowitschia caucasica TaxID=637954 RepID=A0AAV2J5B0_KNICA
MPQDTSDMDALGVLDNLVANTAYLNAQQTDRSELRKRRSSLILPKPKNLRILGKGGFGEVCAVQAKYSGQMYACKKLHKRCLKKKGGERLALLEKQILDKVNSPFIVNLAYAFETETHLCLVMDLMIGGDLKFHIYDLGARGLQMDRVVYYSAQIVCGILHLHSLDIIYRDMKPDNVLLDGKGQCCLSDLGLAVELPKGKTMCQKAGTTGYMAPEILKQDYYRTSVDWWALGCTVYEMVAARLPFKDFREKVQNSEVNRRTLEDAPKFEHKNFNEPTKDIITRFLKKKMDYRLGCSRNGDDPRKHAFFKDINFHRLEVGLVEPPWVPKSNLVYAKDMVEFKDISEEEDVALDAKDQKFFKEFSTGDSSGAILMTLLLSSQTTDVICHQLLGSPAQLKITCTNHK